MEAGHELRISLSARLFDNATDTLWRMRLGNGSMPQAPWAFPLMAYKWLADLLAGLGVPQPRRLVLRRGDDALAVGAERRAQHAILVACERLADLLAGLGVPQPRRLVRRRGDDALAVGAERRAPQLSVWPVSGSPICLPVSASRDYPDMWPLPQDARLR